MKFYVCASVGVLIKWLYEMHGATIKNIVIILKQIKKPAICSPYYDTVGIIFLIIATEMVADFLWECP